MKMVNVSPEIALNAFSLSHVLPTALHRDDVASSSGVVGWSEGAG